MILEKIKIYSQNVHKNNSIINTILETQSFFDVIFIQESSWSSIKSIPSFTNCEGNELVGVSNHPNWMVFSKPFLWDSNSPRVITYINICIFSLCFSLCNDIFHHRDILCVSFFNHGSIFFLINIYSDSSQLALKYLKDTEANLSNVLIMTEDFNIRDSLWDPNFLHHSSHSNTLFEIADSLQIELSKPIKFSPTRFADNTRDSNSVLDLVFLHSNSQEFDNHHIHSDWRLTSDYVPISVNISIVEEYVQTKKQFLIKNSKEESHFIEEVISSLKNTHTHPILCIDILETTVQMIANNIENIW